MGFINDDEIPPGLFQVVPVLAVAFEGIDRDDGAVEIVEWVVVGRDLAPDALDAGGVQPGQCDGETAPKLLLELQHHALGRDHQHPPSPAAAHQFSGQDAGFQRLAEAHRVGDQQARPELT